MRIGKEKPRVVDWRITFANSLQVDTVDIPTGETRVETSREGVESRRFVTESKIAIGFQTDAPGRGKGLQWIPNEHFDAVLDVLQSYAESGVDNMTVAGWTDPVETIHQTIARSPRLDADGDEIEGVYDITFRVRPGKGSKTCRVPEEDFAEFVGLLAEVKETRHKYVDILRAKAEKKSK